MADTRSIFPQDEPGPLQHAAVHSGPWAAAEMPRDKPPYADDCDRPGPFKNPDTTEDPPRTMQLWRDVVRPQPIITFRKSVPACMAHCSQPCWSSKLEPSRTVEFPACWTWHGMQCAPHQCGDKRRCQ